MKNYLKLSLVFIFIAVIFFLACESKNETRNSANSNSAPSADKQTYRTIGVIKAIDHDAGRLTIDHEDIPGYMPAMEMNDAVSDQSLLNSVKIGDRVEFEIERTSSQIVVTKINKIGEVAVLDGGVLYRMNCAKCHGETGAGAKKGIPLISGHALHHSEAEYVAQVENGRAGKMPAFKDKLSKDEITAIVKFVREDLQKDARQNENPNDHPEHHHH